MKIATISDIHIDENDTYDIVGALEAEIRKKEADILIIAGDISADATLTLQTVVQIEEKSGIPVRFVPGNHDLWSRDFSVETTDAVYARLSEDPHCLVSHPVELEKSVIIGDVGWYDYSFGSPRYSDREFSAMSHHGRTWNDKIHNQWTVDNKKTCRWFLDRLEATMETYRTKKQVVVTHMVPIRELTVPETRKDWDYFNAFLGSEELERLYGSYPVVRSIFGHVHYRKTLEKNGIIWNCRCLNYAREWRSIDGKDYRAQIENAIEYFELD